MKTKTGSYRKGWVAALGMVRAVAMSFGTTKSASAEEIVFAEQFGLAYLPLIVMREYKLVAKHAAKNGIDDVEVKRSEERRVGKECVSTCRSRWSPCH